MRKLISLVLLGALCGCAAKPVLSKAAGDWSCLNCDRWGSTENAITDAPPENGIRLKAAP